MVNRWIAAGFARGWLFIPELSPEAVWAEGAKGFDPRDEFGGRSEEDAADFRLRLEKLCAALTQEAELNELGQVFAWGQLTRTVRQRHRLGRLWREKPALAETEIAPPIIVVGQMRAGTTRIHRYLAADPAHSATRFCDSWNPTPQSPDLRPAKSAAMLALAHWLNPWLDTIHPFGSTRADEELGWLAASFDHCAVEAQWHIPSFTAFSEARDPLPVYREFARILRTDAAHRGNTASPRVMKTPQFAEDLATLAQIFPHARIVHARRNSEDVLESAVSLVANQMAMQTDNADENAIRREWRRKIELREQRATAALADFPGLVADVDFERLGRNWRSEMEAIYASLRMPLTEAALAAMSREVARGKKAAHRDHRKQLRMLAKQRA